MDKLTSLKINLIVNYIVLVLQLAVELVAIGLACYSVRTFFVGFHNTDYSHNMDGLIKRGLLSNDTVDIVWIDEYNDEHNATINAEAWHYSTGYVYGLKQMEIAFWCFGATGLVIGIFFVVIPSQIEELTMTQNELNRLEKRGRHERY